MTGEQLIFQTAKRLVSALLPGIGETVTASARLLAETVGMSANIEVRSIK